MAIDSSSFKRSVRFALLLSLFLASCVWSSSAQTNDPEDPLYVYRTPQLDEERHHLYESFDEAGAYEKAWIKSKAINPDNKQPKYDGEWILTKAHSKLTGDQALMMNSRARHHAIAARLNKPFQFKRKPLVVQYEVQFRSGQDCGGAYIKLLSAPTKELKDVHNSSPYTIMFGPDKCGNERKLHFIFRHKHPKNGTIREIHFAKANSIPKLDEVFSDGRWHIFRLTLRPDNSYEIQMDKKIVAKGSLMTDFEPSVNPPKEIDDPNDEKPEEWDDRERVPDPDARKPADWDETQPRKISDPSAKKPSDWIESEPEVIPDPAAKKPDDWDPEMDGEWEAPLIANPACEQKAGCGPWKAPLIDNPKYRGKWKPSLIPNPNYKGKWSARKIPNPEYFDDPFPWKMATVDAVAFELWTISNQIAFDNILVADNVDAANLVLDHTYQVKKELADAESDHWFVRMIKQTNKKPWLWVVYLLVIAIPVVLFIGYCCVTPGRHKSNDSTNNQSELLDEPSYEEFLESRNSASAHEFQYMQDEDLEPEEMLNDGGDEAVFEEELHKSNEEEQEDDEEIQLRLRKSRSQTDN